MKIKELIQRVRIGLPTDSTDLSSRRIFSKILSSRAKLIVQKINKRQSVSRWDYQTLNCIELIEALPYDCPCTPPTGCLIYRSKEKLPKPLTGLLNGHMLQSVSTIDGNIEFAETTWENKRYKKGSKYTSSKPDYFIRDNYLFVTASKGVKMLAITGLFEDPIEVSLYTNSCTGEKNNKCISILDMAFPIEQDMVDTLVELAKQEVSSEYRQSRQQNNEQENPQE